MQLYVIIRRNGLRDPEDLQAAAARSTAEGDKPGSGVRWIRSYVTAEESGEVGTVCIYEAESPEAPPRARRAAETCPPTRSCPSPTPSSSGRTRSPPRRPDGIRAAARRRPRRRRPRRGGGRAPACPPRRRRRDPPAGRAAAASDCERSTSCSRAAGASTVIRASRRVAHRERGRPRAASPRRPAREHARRERREREQRAATARRPGARATAPRRAPSPASAGGST